MDASLLTQAVKFHGASLVRHMCAEQQLEGSLVQKEGQELQGQGHMDIEDDDFVSEIQRFIAQKADLLFTSSNEDAHRSTDADVAEDGYAIVPAMETFMGIPDHHLREHFYSSLERRDLLVGVISTVLDSGLVVSVLCLDGGKARDIDQLRITAFCPVKELPRFSAHENPVESFQVKDKVRGAVLSVNQETEKIIISLLDKTLANDDTHLKLGLIGEDDIPVHYKRKLQLRGLTYDEILHSVLGFNNMGNTQCLVTALHQTDEATFMRGLKYAQSSETESAEQLRKAQSQRWAHKSVSEGIAHFKAGRQSQAIGFLNKALQMDPDNVEALVARGAMYANNESYTRAIEDFQLALKVNPRHLNARKYMCETLIAQAEIRVPAGDYEGAENYYREALAIEHENEAAKQGLRHIQQVKREKAAAHFRNASPELSPSRAINDKTAQTLKKLIDEDTELSKERKKRKRSGSGDASKHVKQMSRDANIFVKREIQASPVDALPSVDRHSDMSPLYSRRITSHKAERNRSPSSPRYADRANNEQSSRSYHVTEIKDIQQVAYKGEYDRGTEGTSAQSPSYQREDGRYAHDGREDVRGSTSKYSSSRYELMSDAKGRYQAGEQHDEGGNEWHRTVRSIPKATVDRSRLPIEETRGRMSRWSPEKPSHAQRDELPYQQSSKSRSPTSRHSSGDDRSRRRTVSPDTSVASGSHYRSRSPSSKRSVHRLPKFRGRSRSLSPKDSRQSSRHSKNQSSHKHKVVTKYLEDQQRDDKAPDRGRARSRQQDNKSATQGKEHRSRSDKSEESRSRSSDTSPRPLELSGSGDASRSLSYGRWDSPEVQADGLMSRKRFEQRTTTTNRTFTERDKTSASASTNRMVIRPTAQKVESSENPNLPDIIPGLGASNQGQSIKVIVSRGVRQGIPVTGSQTAATQSKASGSGRNEEKVDAGNSQQSRSKNNQKSTKVHKPAGKKREKSSSSSRHRSKKKKDNSRKKQRHRSKKTNKYRRRSSSTSSSSWSSSSFRLHRKQTRRRSSYSRSSSWSSSSSSYSSRSPSPKRKTSMDAGKRLSMDAGKRLSMDSKNKLPMDSGKRLSIDSSKRLSLDSGKMLSMESGKRLSLDSWKQKAKILVTHETGVKRPPVSVEKMPVKINPQPDKTLSELEKFLVLLKQKKKEQTGSSNK